MHDVVGLDNHGGTQNHVPSQHVDVDNNNDIVINVPVSHEAVDESKVHKTSFSFLPLFTQ